MVTVQYGSADGEEVVVADMSNDFVAEEVVVVDACGGAAINTAPISSAISAPSMNGRGPSSSTCSSTDSFDASNIVEVNEEEIQLDDGSEEMSVAIDLAKLSQGHFSHNDFQRSSPGYVFLTEDGRQARTLEDLHGRTVEVAEAGPSDHRRNYSKMPNSSSADNISDEMKPRMSYAQLIAEALVNAEEGMLTLSEIYGAISAKHPYYRMDARNWQNSIRHNLTLNKSFTKVPRQSSEGRGSYWKIEPGAASNIFKRGARQTPRRTSMPTSIPANNQLIQQDGSNVIFVTIPSS